MGIYFLWVFIMMKVLITEGQYKRIIKEVRNKEEDRNKIYQDENIVVVAPLTHKSSCKYGVNTKWCTAVPSNDEHFKDYMKHGVLIYFIVRSPHKNSKIPEYKFAYYHSFDDMNMESKGWYDMSDYHISGDDSEHKVDMNLVKFLIPDEIFNLVKEYIKNQKSVFLLKQKTEHKEMLNYFMSDPDNVNNLIVNDNTWFISYRTKPFEGYYDDNDFGYIYLSPESMMTVMYVNKKTNKIYYENIAYYIDLRNFKNVDNPRFDRHLEFTEVFSDKKSPNMKETFMKYYPQILKSYFRVRKEFYHPHENEYMYMPPQYVQIGDKIGGRHNSDIVITNITKNNNGKFQFDVTDSSGRLSKNTYYSDDIGLGVRYNKEKHNPI